MCFKEPKKRGFPRNDLDNKKVSYLGLGPWIPNRPKIESVKRLGPWFFYPIFCRFLKQYRNGGSAYRRGLANLFLYISDSCCTVIMNPSFSSSISGPL